MRRLLINIGGYKGEGIDIDKVLRDIAATAGATGWKTLPISVTFAQSFVKGGAATVSSLMMGFAWGMGSLTVPLIGMGADRYGIRETLAVVAFIPLIAAVLAWLLPERGAHHVEPEVDALP